MQGLSVDFSIGIFGSVGYLVVRVVREWQIANAVIGLRVESRAEFNSLLGLNREAFHVVSHCEDDAFGIDVDSNV